MDFGVVGSFDSSTLCSNSNSNVSFALDGNNNNSYDEARQLHKLFGSACYSKQGTKRSAAMDDDDGGEDDDVVFKVSRTNNNPSSGFGDQMLKNSFLQRSNNVGGDCNQQMLSFSSQNNPTLPPIYYHQNASGLNGASMQGIISRVRAPFTPSQWMELEHQAMIYKYIIDNIPVPPHLLNPIRKAFESAHFSCYRSNPLLGWGSVHLGFSNSNDPEPGRCRRTDGKKWRCSRDAVGDQKYCERHMNRGRHRSRKPVEDGRQGQPSNRKTTALPESSETSKGDACLGLSHQYVPLIQNSNSNISDKDEYQHKEEAPSPAFSTGKHHQSSFQEASVHGGEFGLVCSDSLLNPLISLHSHEEEDKSKHFLRQFVDDWPKSQQLSRNHLSDFMSSSSASSPKQQLELDMGLSVGTTKVPWEASMGGPLGEVLHANSVDECKNMKHGCSLNLTVQNWDNNGNNNSNGYFLTSSTSSPTGVLHRPELNSVSNSSAGSSPRGESVKALDANSACDNSGLIFGRGIM